MNPSPISWRKKILFSAIMASTALAFGEVWARAYFHFDRQLHWRIRSSPAWRIDWVRRHEAGVDIFRPGIDLFDPLLGWRNKPNFRNTEPLFGSERVSTNSKGARGKREYPYERTGEPRIVVVGDSFAFGWEVSDEETYAAVLESSLGNVEVINLGVGGYGTDQMLLMLKSEGIKYRPDLVIAGIVSPDSLRNVVNFRDFAKPMFELHDGKLELTGTPVRDPEWWLRREPWRPKLIDIIVVAIDSLETTTMRQRKHANRLTKAIWQEMHRVGLSVGAKTLFLFAPGMKELMLGVSGKRSQGDRALFRRFERENQGEAITLDMTQEFYARIRRGERFKAGHWGPHGHQVIAQALKEKILREQLIER